MNLNTFTTTKLDDQVVKFKGNDNNFLFVELWVYKVEKKKTGDDKEAQFAIMGIGRQIDETRLDPNEPIITLTPKDITVDLAYKTRHVVWIAQGAITYQVVLRDPAAEP